MLNKSSKIYIAGASGLLGSAIVSSLKFQGYTNLITERIDLRDEEEILWLFSKNKPDYVILVAAFVGGINHNNINRVPFIVDNLTIQTNVITSCFKSKVKKLLFLGSSCIYPKFAPQPISEEHLLTGKLEQTNSPYAIAKIAGIEMCRAYNIQYGTNYIAAMPTNLFGPNDHFNPDNSHVIPGMVYKFYHATKNNENHIELWGDGAPRREFLYVDDCADACVFLLENFDAPTSYEDAENNIINVGYGTDISILELAEFIKKISTFKGEIIWNTDMPNGTPRKLLNCEKINKMGWKPKYELFEYIEKTYNHYVVSKALENYKNQ